VMTDQVLRKKAIAVTGGASGIGWAVTSLLYSPGACVYVADINDESLNVLKEEHKTQYATISGEIHTTSLDVRDSAAVNTWIQTVAAHSGRPLDGAVNIAGVSTTKTYPGGIFDVSDGDWDMMIGINLTGTCYSCCALSGPGIMKNGGSIVNFGSAMSKYGKGADGGYSASKHGVLGLSRSLAKELGSRSIRVNCVCPYVARFLHILRCT